MTKIWHIYLATNIYEFVVGFIIFKTAANFSFVCFCVVLFSFLIWPCLMSTYNLSLSHSPHNEIVMSCAERSIIIRKLVRAQTVTKLPHIRKDTSFHSQWLRKCSSQNVDVDSLLQKLRCRSPCTVLALEFSQPTPIL